MGQTPIAGAAVSVNIVMGGSILATLAGATDTNGDAVLKYKIPPKAVTGIYQVAVTATANGFTGSNNTATFTVAPK